MPPECMGGMGPQHMEYMPPYCMEGMSPPMFEHMPPECMGGFDGPMMAHMPPSTLVGMNGDQMAAMPPEAMAAIPVPPESIDAYTLAMQTGADQNAWGGQSANDLGGGPIDGMPPIGGDPMNDPMSGAPMDDQMGGGASMGTNPAFDGAMAAMDGAAAANMAEGMDAANTAADADEGKVDTEPGGGDVV